MPFKNRIRLPFYLSRAQFPMDRSVFRRADGSTKVLSMVVRHTYQGFTDHLPESWHKKLTIALAHDNVTIEGDNYLGDVSLDGDYQIEWQEFLDNPVAPATFQVQVTPFDATNSNCMSCEQVNQLSLEDDHIAGFIGDAGIGSINVYDNDSICCYPATGTIVYTNPTYIETSNLSESGAFTFTAPAVVPEQNNVKIATYRVTCEDGTYDEADVFANFNGSGGEVCCQPSAISVDAGVTTISWEAGCDPVDGFNYDFRTSANPGVPVFTGNATGADRSVSIPSVVLLSPGDYIFTIYSDCGVTQSETTIFNFNVPPPIGECQSFSANYSAVSGPSSATFSYMNCAGDIVNQVVNRFSPVTVCAAISEINNPIYWASNQPDSSFSPLGECGPASCEIWQNTSEENAENISYISCEGDAVEGVTITPGSNFCAQFDTLSGDGIGLLSNLGSCTGNIIEGTYDVANTELDVCGSPVPITAYSSEPFGPGVAMWTDPGLTTRVTGYSFIHDATGVIYNLHPGTGIVGLPTGNSC